MASGTDAIDVETCFMKKYVRRFRAASEGNKDEETALNEQIDADV